MEAAEALQDESILVNIRGQDLVAIEVRYHRSCYKDYTGFLVHQKGNKASGNQSYTSYKKAFEVFCCTVVDTCIIDKLQIMRMVSLQELFIKTVREVENLNDSVEIRGFYLKQKLKARYPLLQFLKPIKRNSSEIVFCKEGFSLLADRWTSQSDLEKLESTDCEYDSEGEGPQLGSDYHCQESRRILYLASQHLQGVIIDTPALSGWPPTANDIRDSAQQLIPPQLFNFLAWITGSADVVEFENFVETGDDVRRKLLSVAQDIVYISTKGRKTMPKHVALGLTMRHMTGSSSIIGILNGLGHSVSHSAVLEHDTALANKQLCTDNIVPEGFIKKIPTTVIWDNNDFREETPSGEGTTHNTNGLLVQRIGCVDDGTESFPCINSESKHLPKKKSAPLTLLQTSWRCTTKGNDKVRSPLAIKVSYMNTLQMNIFSLSSL